MKLWPRCGFLYAYSPTEMLAGYWCKCSRPWGHWLNGSQHKGPRLPQR